MSILFMDGAERNSLTKWSSYADVSVAAAQPGMSGSYCYYFKLNYCYLHKTLSASQSAMYKTFKFRGASGYEPTKIITFYDSAGTAIASIGRNSTSKCIEIYSGLYSSLLATGTIPVYTDTTYLIEIKYVPLNSGGEITVKIDSVSDATYSGDTTAGLENVQQFRFGHSAASLCKFYLDDIVASKSGWLGNQCVQLITPNAAGDFTQWDPSTGANYACVDEVTASDTDYVSTNVTGEIDLYNCSSMSGVIGSVTAIDICARMAYEGTPTPTKQKITWKSGSTVANGSDISPALTFGDKFTDPKCLDPDGAVWNETKINALQIGVTTVA